MREIVAFDDLLAVQPVRSALYVSSGADTKALIFTDPAFLRERGAAALGEIGVYVYIDANMALDDASAKLGFRDARTTIETGAVERGTLFGLPAARLAVDLRTDHGERSVVVVRVHATNEAFSAAARAGAWVPTVFIGVGDGCRFGGNEHCTNKLTRWGARAEDAARVSVSRWWITDHFGDAVVPRQLGVGAVVTSTEAGFPFSFRKVALLSTDWGTYVLMPTI